MIEKRSHTKRQMIEDAKRAALDGRWTEAIDLNQRLIDRSPRDAEAQNRLGHALVEVRRFAPAIEAYSTALRSDPANMIARGNLQRLELLRRKSQTESDEKSDDRIGTPTPRTAVFIEEIGKTWVDELVNPCPMDDMVEVAPGQQLQLEQADDRLYVTSLDGQRLGEIERKTADRIVALIESGNRYDVYALGITTQSLRVIIREVYSDPSQGTKFSFPRQIKTRAYLRERDLLRARDESDFLVLDDDDDEDDDEEGRVSEPGDDDEEAADADTTRFIDDSVQIEEEESSV